MSCVPFTIWKEEPLSPLTTEEVTWLSEDQFYQTSLQPEDECFKIEEDGFLVPCESKAEVASVVLENLEKLINLDELIKEEPFLLDEKILPILDDVVPLSQPFTPKPDPPSLFREFESLYESVEFPPLTLTPPQSPPTESKVLITLEPLLAPRPDIARELAVVDELVRTRVEGMQWTPSPPSPGSSSNSSSSGSDDPEWTPEPVESFEESAPVQRAGRKRARASGGVDKRSRKKEQNKNAATRYRMKKKAEVEVILGEEKELADKNEELEVKIKDMRREIRYLKGLMRELFRAKGVIQ